MATSISSGVIRHTEGSAALVEPQRSVVMSAVHDAPASYIGFGVYQTLLDGDGVDPDAQAEQLVGHVHAQVTGMRWLMVAVGITALACLLRSRGPRITAARREAANRVLARSEPATAPAASATRTGRR